MYKQYFKQVIGMLGENPLLSMISILGTALAIAMIMVIVIVYEVRNANYEPETNRDRMLYLKAGVSRKATGGHNIDMLGYKVIRDALYPLNSAEAVTAVCSLSKLVSAPGRTDDFKCDVSGTDAAFWKVFGFRFVAGKPFDAADTESGLRKAVVTDDVARRLYGTSDVVGRTVLLSFIPYTVCGVVPAVSLLAEEAYASVWVPYTSIYSNQSLLNTGGQGINGVFRCYILAPSATDMPAIKAEVQKRAKDFNTTLTDGVTWDLVGQPDTHLEKLSRPLINVAPDVKGMLIRYSIIITIMLLVPAINLSGMTLSRMRKRMEELAVRKAFGATRRELIVQVLYENMVLTLIGGTVGVAFSYLAVTVLRNWLLSTRMAGFSSGETLLNAEMLLNPSVFVCAFFFCLALNLLSAGIPAWCVSGRNITESLKQQ